MNRFTGMLMVGYSWGQTMMYAVPPDEIWGINFRYLNYLIPLAGALGKYIILWFMHVQWKYIQNIVSFGIVRNRRAHCFAEGTKGPFLGY